jgi:hypothetical protein
MAQRLKVMKVRSGNVVAFALIVFFVSAIWCATLAAPGQALASTISGCSQAPAGMAMADCQRPMYLCGFDSANNLLSHGVFSSARSNDSLKHALSSALGDSSIDVSIVPIPLGARKWKNIPPAEPGQVSVRLFNSVLNL